MNRVSKYAIVNRMSLLIEAFSSQQPMLCITVKTKDTIEKEIFYSTASIDITKYFQWSGATT